MMDYSEILDFQVKVVESTTQKINWEQPYVTFKNIGCVHSIDMFLNMYLKWGTYE